MPNKKKTEFIVLDDPDEGSLFGTKQKRPVQAKRRQTRRY